MNSHRVALVRLLHISDIHFSQTTVPSKFIKAILLSRLHGAGNLQAHLAQGIAGHSTKVMKDLRRSIVEFVKDFCDGDWRDRTHLLCTGDLTTWGDDDSLRGAQRFIDRIARDAALSTESIVLYGNHDVWPEKPGHLRGLPMFWSNGYLSQRRTSMRQKHFGSCSWLQRHLILHGAPSVGLFSLNTVEHCPFWNTLARGTAQVDRYWEGAKKPEQLEQLEAELQAVDVALIFSHHPVYDENHHGAPRRAAVSTTPPPSPGRLAPVLSNAPHVGRVVRAQSPRKHVRFVISGHTHRVYPRPGDLPEQGPLQHGSLVGNCGQLTIGTASQLPVAGGGNDDHSWQSLSLWFDRAMNEIILERTVFAKQIGNDFAAHCGVTAQATAEVLRLPLS